MNRLTPRISSASAVRVCQMGTVADREALEAIVFKSVGDYYTVKSYRTDDIDDKGENIVLNDVNFVWDGFSWIRKD